MNDEGRSCAECRHLQVRLNICERGKQLIAVGQYGRTWVCHPRNTKTERTGGWFNARLFGCCGREGRFWEPKEEASE